MNQCNAALFLILSHKANIISIIIVFTHNGQDIFINQSMVGIDERFHPVLVEKKLKLSESSREGKFVFVFLTFLKMYLIYVFH